MSDSAKKGALILISAGAKVIGYKGFYDLPAKLWQGLVTNPKERERLIREVNERISALEGSSGSDLLEEKKAIIEEVINSSKFLTKEKKAEFTSKLQEIIDRYEKQDIRSRDERDEKVAELLKTAIQTRVKTSEAVKQGINSALMVSGFLALRVGVYTAASLMERHKTVRAEQKSEAREGGYLNEMIVKGFTETMSKLHEGVPAMAKVGFYGSAAAVEWARTKWTKERSEKLASHIEKLRAEMPQALKGMEGAANVMTAAGMGSLVVAEYFEAGDAKAMLDAAFKAWEEKSGLVKAGEFKEMGKLALENLVAAPMRPFHAVGTIYDHLTGAEEVAGGGGASSIKSTEAGAGGVAETTGSTENGAIAEAETTGAGGVPAEPETATGAEGVPAKPEVAGAPASPEAAVAGGAAGATGVAIAEVASTPEIPVERLEMGLVKKGDGILKILEREGVETKSALDAAREAGIVRAGGDTRLTTQAIGRLSVFTETQPDGSLEIKFYDWETEKTLTLDEVRDPKLGLTYEHGTAPGEIATESEAVVAQLERADTEASTGGSSSLEATPGIPHELAGGGVKIIETVAGLSRELNLDVLTDTQVAELAHILNEDLIETSLAQRIELAGFETQAAAQRLVEASAILEKLESSGQGATPEAGYLRDTIRADLQTVENLKEVFEAEAVSELTRNVAGADTVAAGADTNPIESINVRGLGKIEFTYDVDGKPSLNWAQLAEQAKPFIAGRVDELLIPDWEQALERQIVDSTIAKSEVTIGGPIILMMDAIKELEADGHGQSTEAQFLHEQLAQYLTGYSNLLDGDHALVQEAVAKTNVADLVTLGTRAPSAEAVVGVAGIAAVTEASAPETFEPPADMEPLRRWKGETGKVRFVYNRDGSVQDAFIPAYVPKGTEVESALHEWGLTRDQVKDHFYEGYRSTNLAGEYQPSASPPPRYATSTDLRFTDRSPEALHKNFIRTVEKLSRQEATLVEMYGEGLAGTPEYNHWQKETAELRDWVEKKVSKEFGVKSPVV